MPRVFAWKFILSRKSGAISLLRDPAEFARVVFGANLWPKQCEILDAAANHSRVAVKACHASGKTFAIALWVLWWLVAHEDGIVITTAPTWLQVHFTPASTWLKPATMRPCALCAVGAGGSSRLSCSGRCRTQAATMHGHSPPSE